MSVYSGFVTRLQENSYNRAVYNMMCLLQMKVSKSYKQGIFSLSLEPFDDIKFAKYFTRFYQKIVEYDKSKHLPPKFSYALKDLAAYYGISQQLSSEDSSSAINSVYKFRDDSMTFIQTPRTLQSVEQSLPQFNNTSYISLIPKETTQLNNKPLKKEVKLATKRQPSQRRSHSLNPYLSEKARRASPVGRRNVLVRKHNNSDIGIKPGSILFQKNIRLSLPNTYRRRSNERRFDRKLLPISGSITRRRSLLIRTYTNREHKKIPPRFNKHYKTDNDSAPIIKQ